MEFALIAIVGLVAAAVTFFSGFGLGTALLPAFAFVLPLETAIVATAIVHLLNNLAKLAYTGRWARWRVVLLFGVPGAVAALAGAWTLTAVGSAATLATYELGGRVRTITLVGVLVGALITALAALELWPRFTMLAVGPRLMPVGGAVSGFLGGFSGHQGALRSAFLVRAGLSAREFIGTGVACAVMIDLARLAVYARSAGAGTLRVPDDARGWALIATGAAAALAGTLLGGRLVRKVTMRTIRIVIGCLLMVLGVGIAAGLVAN